MTIRPVVYIAGPITNGDTLAHIGNAMRWANKLFRMGFAPVVPHLNCYIHAVLPLTHAEWLEWDIAMLRRCDAVFRFGLDTPSSGADEEQDAATMSGIPVFTDIAVLSAWGRKQALQCECGATYTGDGFVCNRCAQPVCRECQKFTGCYAGICIECEAARNLEQQRSDDEEEADH